LLPFPYWKGAVPLLLWCILSYTSMLLWHV
jgi:hypothetical protein